MSISPIGPASVYSALDRVMPNISAPSPAADATRNFAAIFDNADAAVEGFAAGNVNTQTVVEALSQTEMALQTAVTIRDQVVGAYQELLRMPL